MRNTYLLILLILCCGCGGHDAAGPPQAVPATRGAGAPGLLPSLLPDISGLPADEGWRETSLEQSEVVLPAAHYYGSYSANVQSEANLDLSFSPSYTGQQSAASGIAWAMYRFQFSDDDFDRAPQLRLNWVEAPAASSDAWLGLSDWDYGRWHFVPFNAQWVAEISDFERFYDEDASGLQVALLLLGTQPARLKNLRLGGVPPTALLRVSPESGGPALQVTLDASGSLPGEGEIVKYEWDYNTDGIFDLNSGTDAVVEWTYEEVGSYWPSVRVTNSLGLSSQSVQTPVRVTRDWSHSIGRPDVDVFSDLAVDAEGNLYVCGYIGDPTPQSNRHDGLLASYSASGELRWLRSTAYEEGWLYLDRISVDSAGNVIVCGPLDPGGLGGYNTILQKWDSEGNLLWSRDFTREEGQEVFPVALTTFGESIYLVGSRVAGGGFNGAVAALLDGDGSFVSGSTRSLPTGLQPADMLLRSDDLNPLLGLSVICSSNSGPVRLDYDFGAEFSSASLLSISGPHNSYAVVEMASSSDIIAGETFYIGGFANTQDLKREAFVISIPPTGSSIAGRHYPGVNRLTGLQLSAGRLRLSGLTVEASASANGRGWFGSVELPGLTVDEAWEIVGISDTQMEGILPAPGGGVLLCGFAPNAAPFFLRHYSSGEELTASWGSISTTSAEDDFVTTERPLEVIDMEPLVIHDTGAGGLDAYLSYREVFD